MRIYENKSTSRFTRSFSVRVPRILRKNFSHQPRWVKLSKHSQISFTHQTCQPIWVFNDGRVFFFGFVTTFCQSTNPKVFLYTSYIQLCACVIAVSSLSLLTFCLCRTPTVRSRCYVFASVGGNLRYLPCAFDGAGGPAEEQLWKVTLSHWRLVEFAWYRGVGGDSLQYVVINILDGTHPSNVFNPT